ncbi:MAG TPA: FKBP-type peptidyl-prolyl cis-trans isomerase, partial [Chitinophagaceae bacterium]|nr:FKBP-type peptidyl-prolyl cis-trans isomerase [Chitinophagaceae bacterium]
MIKKISLATLIGCGLISGSSVSAQSFKQLPNGLEYLIVKDAPGTKTIQEGSVVSMHIRTKIADSAMFDSYKMNNDQPIEQPLTQQFLGSFMDGFKLLTSGDSAIFRLPIDSAFHGSQLPPFAKSGDKVIYTVK